MKTYEIFTEKYSKIIQAGGLVSAIMRFYADTTDNIIAIHDVEFNPKILPSQQPVEGKSADTQKAINNLMTFIECGLKPMKKEDEVLFYDHLSTMVEKLVLASQYNKKEEKTCNHPYNELAFIDSKDHFCCKCGSTLSLPANKTEEKTPLPVKEVTDEEIDELAKNYALNNHQYRATRHADYKAGLIAMRFLLSSGVRT